MIRGVEIKIDQGNGIYFWHVKYREGAGERELLGNNDNVYASLRDVRSVIAPLIQAPDGKLTPRRIEILRYLIQGYTYGQIALELGISERGVKDAMQQARKALGCASMAQLVYRAIVAGYLP